MDEHLIQNLPKKFILGHTTENTETTIPCKLSKKKRDINITQRDTTKVLESWLIIPLLPVGILLGWDEGQMLICCVNLFIYFRLYNVPDGKL